MAPPKNQQQMRPSRSLAVLALLLAVIYAFVFFGGSGSIHDKLKPKLGLDLVGGTTMTLVAHTPDGKAPKASQLEQARQIIEDRVNGLGVAEPEIVTEGTSNIVISVADTDPDALKSVATTAQLRFRTVLNEVADVPANQPTPTPTASGTGSPSAKPTASASGTPSKAPTPTAPASASASPSATPANLDQAKLLENVKKAVGISVYNQAAAINDTSSAAGVPAFDKFGKLSPEEVAVLPANMQFNLPQITCDQLDNRPPGSIELVDQVVVACDHSAGGSYKQLLDKASVLGTDLADAQANIDQNGGWKVDLKFGSKGADKWGALTNAAYNQAAQTCPNDQRSIGAREGGGDACRVAVVLDNKVVSAPVIQAVLRVQSQITGPTIGSKEAKQLANQLKYGALPLTFSQGDATSISATLGTEQLKAGLLAAGIGMLLVIIYAFFYYRILGSVIFLSLVISGLLTFGMLLLLGRGIGFTLTLAGIAGFIVSLGVAADSFVIYFERLKDEIRDGRSPRSAVVRAWQRAKRTIITANTVSILAALTLYLFGVGSVRGFAFALGLATLLDLFVVFLFRHPMMTLLASTKAFMSPRVSGLGRVLERTDAPASTAKTKEA